MCSIKYVQYVMHILAYQSCEHMHGKYIFKYVLFLLALQCDGSKLHVPETQPSVLLFDSVSITGKNWHPLSFPQHSVRKNLSISGEWFCIPTNG